MSEKSEAPPGQPAKPMPAIDKMRLFDTGNPNLLGIGFETPVGYVLLGASRKRVLEMIAMLRVAVEQMREPS
jgi:hypothetical protein